MDILIEAATGNVNDLEDPSRQALQGCTKEYDDLPDDWSKGAWNAWWGKHRKQWKPPSGFAGGLPGANMRRMHEIFQGVAAKFEAERKR
jgi:hypothetical protein